MIFVVAGDPHLSHRVVEQLTGSGVPVVVGCQHEPFKPGSLNECPLSQTSNNVNSLGINSLNAKALAAAMTGADTVIIVSGHQPTESRIQDFSTTLSAAKKAAVGRVIFLSRSCAQPDSCALIAPFLMYAETALRTSGLEWLILRVGLMIDPVAKWIPQITEWGYLPSPVVRGRANYVSGLDVAKATAAAAQNLELSGEVLELTGPKAITVEELVNALAKTIGNSVTHRLLTGGEFTRVCLQHEMPEQQALELLSVYQYVDEGGYARATDHIERLTGATPESALTALKRLNHSSCDHTAAKTSPRYITR